MPDPLGVKQDPRTPPRPADEAERLAALRRFAILDTPRETAFDDITRLLAYICRAPIARITFIDEGRQWMKSEIGVRLGESPRDESICAHAILEPGLAMFSDLAKDPRFATHPRVSGEPHLRFYAAAPLRTRDGYALGTLCILDYKPRKLNKEQKALLEALARQVMTQLELHRDAIRQQEIERERAEQAVFASEARYRSLVTVTSSIVWRAAPGGEIAEDVPSWQEFTGQTVRQYKAYGWIDAVHPDDRRQTTRVWEDARPAHAPLTHEFRLRHKDGDYHDMVLRGIPLLDRQGAVAEWIAICADTTETRKAQAALQRKERELRTIADVMPALIAHIDSDQRFLFANRAYEQWCGRNRADVIGATVREVVGESAYAGALPHIERVLSGQPVSFDHPAVYPDGRARFVHGDYLPDVDEQGKVRGFFALIADTSEHHRFEAMLERKEHEMRLITDSVPALIAYIDAERRYRFANRTYERWFGVGREQVYGKTVVEIIGKTAYAAVREEVDLALSGQAVAFERWVPYTRGPERWIQVNYIPDVAEGQVRGFFALVVDISRLKRAESRVQAQYAVSAVLATATAARAVTREILRSIAQPMQWDVGSAWRWDEQNQEFHCLDLWSANPAAFAEFERVTRTLRLPSGAGVPGRVRATRAPVWIADISGASNLPRAGTAQRCGLRAAFAFPVLVEGEVEAVIEFFSRSIRKPDQGLLQTMAAIGRDIGHFVLRRRAEREIKRLNANLEHHVAELQTLMDVAPVGLAVARDPDCKFITSNRAFAELVGVAPDSNVSLTPDTGAADDAQFRVFKDGVECATEDLPMQLAVRRREKIESIELEVRRADGRRINILSNAAPLFDGEGAVRGVISSQVDITDLKRVEGELAKHSLQLEKLVDDRTAQLRELSAHLQSVREEEKAHIAREVHDELGGVLTGLKMDATWLRQRLTDSTPAVQNKVAGLLQLIDTAIAAVRKIQSDLRPALLDDLGLVAALDWQAQEFAKRSGVVCEFAARVADSKFGSAQAITLFRGFQEALTNIARHAGANRVTANLIRDNGAIVLAIGDDGVGMESVRLDDISRHGIRGMQERVSYLGGSVSIDSAPGRGTKVTITLPDAQRPGV